jgi:hypothetical protein
MKTKFLILSILFMIIGVSSIFAQGFQPPAPGKAVVYFTRTFGSSEIFDYFHQDRFIGTFKGSNYIRYELEPGQQLVWASSENKEFVEGDFKEGGSYIIVVDFSMGAWKIHVVLNPINASDKRFKRAKELINSKAPVVTTPEKIEEINKKLTEFIPEQLRKYEQEWKDTKVVKHMSADMAIPEEAMK